MRSCNNKSHKVRDYEVIKEIMEVSRTNEGKR